MTRTATLQVKPKRISGQPASIEDQRLTLRVLAVWQDWCLDDEFPRRADIAEDIFLDDWQHCFIMDCASAEPFPALEVIGGALARFSGLFRPGSSQWSDQLIDKARSHVALVHASRDAVLVDEVLERHDARSLALRCILLPLSSDGHTISHILGAANGKLLDAIR